MWQLIISGDKEVLKLIEVQVEINAQATILDEPVPGQTTSILTIISDHPLDLSSINILHPYTIISNDPLPEKDWLAENRASFKPIMIDPFFIYSSLHKDDLQKDKINMCIDASTAFGTGHHETTSGCLEALIYLQKKNFNPNHFLDIGTGTGILAMAAAQLFKINGIATDNDPEAVKRICENLKINNFTQQIYAVLDNDLSAHEIKFFKPYPLIMANILLEPLINLASLISDNLEDEGYLILSGILTNQVDLLKQAYHKFNLILAHHLIRGEWSILILMK